jgi:hypothetical protein
MLISLFLQLDGLHHRNLSLPNDVPHSCDVSNVIDTNGQHRCVSWGQYLVSIPEQDHTNVEMDDRRKTNFISMHVLLSVSGPVSLCFALGRGTLGHSSI